MVGGDTQSAANSAQAGKTTVENNFLSPDDRDVRDKALEDQKAGRNLKEASQNIIYLSDKDAYTDKLVTLYTMHLSQVMFGIYSEIKRKVTSGQTTNVVINMSDTKVSVPELQQQLTKWPVMGLDKVIIVDKSGNVMRMK